MSRPKYGIRWIQKARNLRYGMTREIRFNVAGDPHGDVPTLQPDSPPGAQAIVCSFESPMRLLAVIPETNTGAGTLFYQQR